MGHGADMWKNPGSYRQNAGSREHFYWILHDYLYTS